MEFRKYMHVERYGNKEVKGIELGTTYIFTKLDGTNGSVWMGDEGVLHAGSRNREVFVGNDNAGFCAYVTANDHLFQPMLDRFPKFTLYGEWLVPHTLKVYEDTAWRRFYVFDVFNNTNEEYLSYEEYQPILEEFGIDYIPPIAIIKNGDYEKFLYELKNATFLARDGEEGEGIVLKNYDFKNQYGRTVWAKMVTNAFKSKAQQKLGPPTKEFSTMVEEKIVLDFVTEDLVLKTVAKITNENDGWSNKCIPRLLQTVFYDLIREESWNFIKKYKNPQIDYRVLNQLTIQRIKQIVPEVF